MRSSILQVCIQIVLCSKVEYDVSFPAIVVDAKHRRLGSDVCLVETLFGKQILIFSVCFKRK